MYDGQTIRIKCVTGGKSISEDKLVNVRSTAYHSRLEGGYSDNLAELYEHPDFIQTCTVPASAEPDVEGTYMDDDYAERYQPAAELALQPAHDQIDDSAAEELEKVEQSANSTFIRYLLGCLNERSQLIITQRFGLDDNVTRTLEEVGALHDLTRERIRQIEAKSLAIMRDASRFKLSEGGAAF